MLNQDNVSVIIPAYNEENYIRKAVLNVVNQAWPGNIEILIVDGGSTDQTVPLLEELQKELPENRSLKVLHNPARHIPISLNLACENAAYDIIVRTDAHTYVPESYVSQQVQALKKIDFKGIAGGRIEIFPGAPTCMAEAITISVGHPLGVGNALYRTFKGSGGELLEVDTVPFGAFAKALWKELGGYDETLLFDEDYDFNFRAKKAGYRIVLNPEIVLEYFSRKDLGLLWKQYYRYGYWANQTMQKHKIIPSIRRFIPAVFVLVFAFLAISEVFWGLKLFWLYLGVYALPILGISVLEGLVKRKRLGLTFCLIPTFPTLHFSYGIGSILSLVSGYKRG
jgi:succinoglycan biosynthesis protein ExoA